MRLITRKAIAAFNNAKPFCLSNTCVTVQPNVTVLSLHGNAIAYQYNDPERTLSITAAGWLSNTTKERLNAINGVFIAQKAGIWYLNGKAWEGKLIDIKG